MKRENPDFHEANDREGGRAIPVRVVKSEEPLRVTDRRFWAQEDKPNSETPESAYSFKPSYVEDLEKKLAESQRTVQEILATYREHKAETAAETQRTRERIQNEYARRLQQAKAEVLRKFIEVLENFERALAAAKSNSSFDSLLEGVEIIRNQFSATLTDLGVSEIDVIGKPFDPETAEAVGIIEVPSEKQDQQVIEVIAKGYLLDEILVRPARVRVGRHLPATQQGSTA